MRSRCTMMRWLRAGGLALLILIPSSLGWGNDKLDILHKDNLVAWCIVPFDASKRGPAERARMLKELGIRRCAYDWRQEHVDTFEQEILAYQEHGIEFFAFWDLHPKAFELFAKYKLRPQIWQTLASPPPDAREEMIEAAVRAMLPGVQAAAKIQAKFGLYNHGGWGGQPENLVAVCQRLREFGHEHVGIVYNFHHGHEHIADWPKHFELLKPYLLCVNLNGMNPGAEPKILGLGKGGHELEMIRVVVESGYSGPVGIIDHRTELDARESLQENLEGLEWLRKELKAPGRGGPKPAATQPAKFGSVLPGSPAFRTPPITVELRARLAAARSYNILVACDTKQSADHWELFTLPGSGRLTVYIPGYEPDHVHTAAAICDGMSHDITMTLEAGRVRLWVDGKQAADQPLHKRRFDGVPGGLGIGRLVEGGLGCDGQLAWVRISKGVREPAENAETPPARDERTVGYWTFDTESSADSSHGHVPAGGLPATLEYDPSLVDKLLEKATKQGDAVRGAAVFANAKSACLSCHRAGSHGGAVGPELTCIAQKRTPQHLVESLLWPKRHVEPEYVSWKILTTAGDVLTGFKLGSDDVSVTLQELSTGRQVTLPIEDIEQQISGTTPMPDGLLASLSEQQQADLVRFLMELKGTLPPDVDHTLAHSQMLGPATFPYDAAPLDPTRWPQSTHTVNRDRLYDFYTKQAEYFRKQERVPMLLAPFPGMDGGQLGHWGNQDEQTWSDGRWNDTDLGSLQCGVLHFQGRNVPRAVCLRLGDSQELAVCFNPDTLMYEAMWQGGFVSFSPVRHGFVSPMTMKGRPQPLFEQQRPAQPFKYHGYYRIGKRVVFSYRIGDTEYLDAPWARDGQLIRELAPAEHHSARSLLTNAPAQWPQTITTEIKWGDSKPYAVDTIELPLDNPWKALLFCSGHDFLPDGSALVCTIQGDVWRVDGLDTLTATWRRFASGLHQPLGLLVHEGQIFVQCRDQLTRLHDLNGDGEADFYECVSNAFITSPAGHDFICGLQRDSQGNFYTASGNQGLLRISADGSRADAIATGFRNPDGLSILPDGTITVPCSEGEWTPASMICVVRPQDMGPQPLHFGYRGPKDGKPPALPLVYLPRGLDNSSGEQVYVDSDRWGPLNRHLVHLSFGMGSHFLILRDEVAGQMQGAAVPLAGDFRSGIHRGRFRSADGQLYVTGMQGWGSYTPEDGCFQRIRFTGDRVQLPMGFHVHENGIIVRFERPLDRRVAEDLKSHFAQAWNYRYSAAYGSPEYSSMHPGSVGHDPLRITSAHVLADGRSLFLEIPDLQPVSQLHLRLHVNEREEHSVNPAGSGHDLFLTVHRLDEPFTGFPGYMRREKTIAAHPLLADMALSIHSEPNAWMGKIAGARTVEIQTAGNLTFATQQFKVKAGEAIELVLSNPDVVPHNWALVKPGTLQQVGELANRLISNPHAAARQYIPQSADVLVFTDVVPPGQRGTIYFHAPRTPGRYPYLCTFPGHWMVMNGEMVVE